MLPKATFTSSETTGQHLIPWPITQPRCNFTSPLLLAVVAFQVMQSLITSADYFDMFLPRIWGELALPQLRFTPIHQVLQFELYQLAEAM